MLRFNDSILNMDALNRYQSENIEFKEEAKKLIADYLGFQPELGASWKEELWIRQTLKRVQEGKATSEQLEQKIKALGGLTKAKLKDLEENRI